MKNILQKIQKLLIRFFKKLYIGMIFWGVYVILVCIFWILAKILIAQFGANWMNISIFWSSLLAFWLCLVFLKVFWKKIIHYFFNDYSLNSLHKWKYQFWKNFPAKIRSAWIVRFQENIFSVSILWKVFMKRYYNNSK